ncbi:MAG TPA: bifunctional nuclease family protein [Nitrospira sp.]
MATIGPPILSIILASVLFFPSTQAAESQTVLSEQVPIANVEVRLSDRGPVVLLHAEGKTIPIFVDRTVALSIQAALNGQRLSRPLSHDLMHTILRTFGGSVTQTVITLSGGTYFGALTVRFRDEEKVFDSRSSDSIALAIHFHAPIKVGRELLDSAGTLLDQSKTEDL